MATETKLKSIKFEGIDKTYTIPEGLSEADIAPIMANINDETNKYTPGTADESFNDTRNTILGKGNTIGSNGFKITEDNFHQLGYGLFIVPSISGLTYSSVKKLVCTRYEEAQEFDVISAGSSATTLALLTTQYPYLFSDDLYTFTKMEYKDASGTVLATTTSDGTESIVNWYGCVTKWLDYLPSTVSVYDFLLPDSPVDYEVNHERVGSYFKVDVTPEYSLTSEPTCIKINNNYSSAPRQVYIDQGDDGNLNSEVAETCLKANYTEGNDYLTLSLKRATFLGSGLSGKPVFSGASCIFFPDKPGVGDTFIGEGCNVITGQNNSASFDNSFVAGKNNHSVGRYGMALGNKNSVVYGSVAMGNHNSAIGQSSSAFGEGNYIDEQGFSGTAIGNQNTVKAKGAVALGRNNLIEEEALYSTSIGGYNKIGTDYAGNKKSNVKAGVALGWNNTIAAEGGFASGSGNIINGKRSNAIGVTNTIDGENSSVIGTNNSITGNYSTATGLHNTINVDNSFVTGKDNTITNESSSYGDAGNIVGGTNNTIKGGRNNLVGGQSNTTAENDSLIWGNNLKSNRGGLGNVVLGNYNNENSTAALQYGAGTKDSRKNAFEVYTDGAVVTPNARSFSDNEWSRLTTKLYVDQKSFNTVQDYMHGYEADSSGKLTNTKPTAQIVLGNEEYTSYSLSGIQYKNWGIWSNGTITTSQDVTSTIADVAIAGAGFNKVKSDVNTLNSVINTKISSTLINDTGDQKTDLLAGDLRVTQINGSSGVSGGIKIANAVPTLYSGNSSATIEKVIEAANNNTSNNLSRAFTTIGSWVRTKSTGSVIADNGNSQAYLLLKGVPKNRDDIRYATLTTADGALTFNEHIYNSVNNMDFYRFVSGGTSGAVSDSTDYFIVVTYPFDRPFGDMSDGSVPLQRAQGEYRDGIHIIKGIAYSDSSLASSKYINAVGTLTYDILPSKITFTKPLIFDKPQADSDLVDYSASYSTQYKFVTHFNNGNAYRKDIYLKVKVDSCACTDSWGSIYEGPLGNYAFANSFFKSTPEMTVEVANTVGGGWIEGNLQPTSRGTGSLYMTRPTSATLTDICLLIHAWEEQ